MRKALLFLPLALLCSLFGYALHEMVHVPPAFASGIGGGGGTGTAGPTGPTGPAWTTSAEARASMSDESGTGAMLFAGGDIGSASGTQLALAQGISAATGLFSGNITMSGTSATGLMRVNPSNGSTNGVWIVANGTAEALYAESANNASSQACQCAGISNGNGVLATGTGTGVALTATNTSGGLPVVINGDTTSPAVGQIRMPVLDTNPTSCQVGDMFMFTGGILRVCTATTPTWVNVGSQ